MKRTMDSRESIARSEWMVIQPAMNDFQWNIALPNEEGVSQGVKRAGGHLRPLHETRSLFSLCAFNLQLGDEAYAM